MNPTKALLVLLITGIAFNLILSPVSHAVSPVTTLSGGDGSTTDPNIAFFGRWDKTSISQFISYWPGAYLKTNFTGPTLKLKLGGPANFYVKIDAADDVYYSITTAGPSTINLTPTPLNTGVHFVRVAARSETDILKFEGLVLAQGATTLPINLPNNLVEFIGDSITAGYSDTKWALSDYAWLAAEKLNVEHTQIAYSGICLVDATQCFSPNAIGMSRQYFKLQTVDYPSSPDWNFANYQPSVIVINLGSNDAYFQIDDTLFTNTYVAFLQNIRAKLPNAQILVLRAFNGSKAGPTEQAVNTRISVGDTGVHYIDTTSWLAPGDTNDGTHPSDAGQLKLATILVPILQQYLAACHAYSVTGMFDDGSGFACGTLSYALDRAATDNVNPSITITLPTLSFLSAAMPPVTSQFSSSITLAGGCTVLNNQLVPDSNLIASDAAVPGITIASKTTLNGIKFSGFKDYALKAAGKNNKLSCIVTDGSGLRVAQGGQVQLIPLKPGSQIKGQGT